MDARDPNSTAAAPLGPSDADEAPVSLRQSVYQLAGSSRSHAWPTIVECFIPLLMCGAVEGLSTWLDSIMQNNLPLPASNYVGVAPDAAAARDQFFSFAVSDWSARNVVVLVSTVFFVLALATVCTVSYVIHEALEQVTERALLKRSVAALATVTFVTICLFRNTGASRTMERLLQFSDVSPHALYVAMYASGTMIIVLVACAMCTLLVPDLRATAVRIVNNQDIVFLARRMRWTRAIIYTLAPFLVVSTVESYAVTSSIAVYIVGAENQRLMWIMATRSTLMFGVFYSVLLFCVYAPTEGILRIRAMKLASDANIRPTDRAHWLEERSLKLSAFDQIKTSLALLSPIFASLAGLAHHMVGGPHAR
jgi:hypothetical protein